MRSVKRPKRVKVYGLDSTKNVRARLIEILMERVMYHKDKFVAPILHSEMQSMQIKKSGKVEHSDNSHDDQVFSYLMALYVWYEGKNLVENFGLRKSTIRTDTDIEIEEADIEDALEKREQIDFNSSTFEHNQEIAKELEWIEREATNFITSRDLQAEQYFRKIEQRNIILNTNPTLSARMEEETGVKLDNYTSMGNIHVDISQYLYDTDDDTYDMDEDLYGDPNSRHSVLQGNLASFYDSV